MRRRRHKLQVSTFPFLAVLLCAMGALLLVLLVMDRRAHDAARARANEAARRAAEEAAQDVESRRAAVEQARVTEQLAQEQQHETEHARLAGQLAGVQGEVQTARDEFAEAAARLHQEQEEEAALKQRIADEHAEAEVEQQAILQVRGEEAKNAGALESSRKELPGMTAELKRLERALADLKSAREKQQKTYSVVPYNGKQGENRRPLYIECGGGQVIFHPDKLSLPESRIPADAQAEVERRLARQKERLPPDQASAFAPYLMLLVRPDGVVSYYRLREALRGIKIDFGYEFIDADWALDFPTNDAAPVQPWMTSAKPPAFPPSATPPGPSSMGPRSGFGPAAPPAPPADIGVQGSGNAAPSTSFADNRASLPPAESSGVAVAPSAGSPWMPKSGSSATLAAPSAKGDPTLPPPPPVPGETKPTPSAAHPVGADGVEDDPFLRAPPAPLPKTERPAPSLRPARLVGDRDWIVFVECKPEGVVVYPTRLLVPTSALAHPSGGNPLMQSIQQLIDRKQATVRAGEPPYRPEVRFLVHPDAGRTYHLAYPMLDNLAAPKTAQDLTPDDDVSVLVTGH
jgi:hypothetical protein